MNATIITAAEIVAELAEMFPAGQPGMSTPDRIVANKLAELQAMLAEEIASYEQHLEDAYVDEMARRHEEKLDAQADAVSAGWGWD